MVEIIKKSPETINEAVTGVSKRYEDARDYHNLKLARITDNWHFYWGLYPELGQGQWPAEVVDVMLQQKRQLLTYNIAKVIVDTIAGGIMQSLYDPTFIAVSSVAKQTTEVIRKAMYSDKELMDWDSSWLEFVIGGLVGEAAMKMIVSTEFDPLGNIGFKTLAPGGLITDPGWKTHTTKDLRVCWQEGWFTPKELAEYFPDKKDLIMSNVVSQNKNPMYGGNHGIVPWNSREDNWGDRQKVISEYRMIEKRVERDHVLIDGEEIQLPDIPDMAKPEWLNANYPQWQPDMVYTKPVIDRYCTVDIVCPRLTAIDFLYSGKAQVQCGQVPFFIWSASRHNGECHTIIDAIKDGCRNVNYWESMLTYKLQTEGGGGSKLIDPIGFKDTEEANKCANSYNDPTRSFETAPGVLVNGKGKPIQPIQDSPLRTDIVTMIQHVIHEILPQTSKVVPATTGRTEQSQTSGRLFQMLKMQSDQQTYTVNFGLENTFSDIFDGYFHQAVELYSAEDVERTFTLNKGTEEITLNKHMPDGTIANRVADLKNIRHKTIVSKAKASPTDKMANLQVMSEYMQSLAPIAQFKPATIGLITKKMAENIDQFSDEDMDELEEANAKEYQLQVAQIDLAIASAQFQKMQIDMQMQAMGVPRETQPGAVTPGQPANASMGGGAVGPTNVPNTNILTGPQAPSFQPNGATSPGGVQ